MKALLSHPVGVFDSGLGGLTVLKELIATLPTEQIIYLGDTARVPYGNKSIKTVTRYSFENTNFLLKKVIKFLIVACNTASAFSIDAIKERFSVPCLGVIQPGVKAAVERSRSGKIGVIGTKGTILSNAYSNSIKKINPDLDVFEAPCPLFVPLVEEGWIDNEVTRIVVKTYLEPLIKKDIDVLILGCTHYPLLKGIISDVVGPEVILIDSAKETAAETLRILGALNLVAPNTLKGGCQIYVTDLTEQFTSISNLFLRDKSVSVSQISLDEMV